VRVLLLLIALLGSIWAGEQTAKGQAITASLNGIVQDTQGAVLPGAKITLTHNETGRQWSLTADERGFYLAPSLPVGTYTLIAEARGFKRFTQRGIVLEVNQEARSDITMAVGGVDEVVTVDSSAELVNTYSSTIQTTVDNRRMVELPLNGRNIFNLVFLTPGVGVNGFLGRSINGGRPEQESVQMDGGDFLARISSGGHPQNTYPPPDAVQEFTILANAFKAEYGLGGVVVNAITKSGTNDFHGTLWEFLRHDRLDARAFFSARKSKLRQNQFGGNLGGPIYLPRVGEGGPAYWSGNNRAFFFVDYDGFRNRGAPSPNVSFVPTAAERQGDFSASSPKPIDPLTGRRFPGDQIPASRIHPISARLLQPDIVPLPNLGNDRFSFVVPGGTDRDQVLIKTDFVLRKEHNLSLRLLKTYGNRGISAGALPAFNRRTNNKPAQAVVNWTWNVNSTSVNEMRFAANRVTNISEPVPDVENLTSLGFTYAADNNFFPEINIPNLTRIGRFQGFFGNIGNTFQWLDNYSRIIGPHSIKAGGQITRIQFNFRSEFFSAGGFTVDGSFTGNAYADLLLGLPSSFSQNSVSEGAARNSVYSFFAQDDFKVNRRLTLNYGLRYDLQPWPSEKNNKFVTFSVERYRQGIRSKVFPTAPPGFIYIGDLGNDSASLFGGTGYNKWQPRVGFAYDLTGDGRTSLRGSYGVFFEVTDLDRIAQFQTPPFILSKTIFAPPSFADPYVGQVSPFPYTPTAGFNFKPLLPLNQRLPSADFTHPYHQHWNLSLEREVVRDFVVSLAYVANKGTHLTAFTESNPAVFIPGTDAQGRPLSTIANTNSRRIYAPEIGGLSTDMSLGNNSYHSLQITANKRFSQGYTILSAYTWSHNIDDQSSASSAEGPQRPFDFRGERGNSFLDFRHRWVVSFIWELPKMRAGSALVDRIINGWELTGVHTLQTGNPINIRTGQDNSRTGLGQDRPNLVGNPFLPDDRPKAEKLVRWIDISAFQPNPIGTFGNLGRNVIYGPGLWNFDFGMFKNFAITENQRLQFRWELFNAFNHANFRGPSSWSLSAPSSFGRITSTATGPRQMQFGLKYQF
jgi:hypothetical protein